MNKSFTWLTDFEGQMLITNIYKQSQSSQWWWSSIIIISSCINHQYNQEYCFITSEAAKISFAVCSLSLTKLYILWIEMIPIIFQFCVLSPMLVDHCQCNCMINIQNNSASFSNSPHTTYNTVVLPERIILQTRYFSTQLEFLGIQTTLSSVGLKMWSQRHRILS